MFLEFSPLPWEMIQFESYFSSGLKPPTRRGWKSSFWNCWNKADIVSGWLGQGPCSNFNWVYLLDEKLSLKINSFDQSTYPLLNDNVFFPQALFSRKICDEWDAASDRVKISPIFCVENESSTLSALTRELPLADRKPENFPRILVRM